MKKSVKKTILLIFIICVFSIGVAYLFFSNMKLINEENQISYVNILYDNADRIVVSTDNVLPDAKGEILTEGINVIKFKVNANLYNTELAKYKLLLNSIYTTSEVDYSDINVMVTKNGEKVYFDKDKYIIDLASLISNASEDKKVKNNFVSQGRLKDDESDEYVVRMWVSDSYVKKYSCKNTIYLTKGACEKNGSKWEETPFALTANFRILASE